ncbi:MAG: LysE family transporter [Candidatus Onthomonas sp.]
MTAAAFTSLLGYMLVCSFTPGPGNILALNTTSTYGWKRSRYLILGICLGYALVQTICSVALYRLNQFFSPALEALRVVGGIYMVWLAIHMFRSQPEESAVQRAPSLLEGLLLQLVNGKIYFYISSLLSAYFIPYCETILELALAGVFAVCIGSAACLTWAFLGVRLQSVYLRYFRPFNAILGSFLLYCAWTIVKG